MWEAKTNRIDTKGKRKFVPVLPNSNVQLVVYIVFILAVPSSVSAAVFNVHSGDVEGLISAIEMANKNAETDSIRLEPGTYTLTQVNNDTDGPNGLPSIESFDRRFGLSIFTSASEAPAIIERAAPDDFRILHVGEFAGAVLLQNVVIKGGSSANNGGGLFNRGRGTFLINSAVSGNSADIGGGIFNAPTGNLTLGTVTIEDNKSGRYPEVGGGGGIFNEGVLTIIFSTISRNNNAVFGGGGIKNNGGRVTLNSSTVSDNTSGGGGGGAGGGIINTGAGTLTITNSTISGNEQSSGRGGGINNSATLGLNNVTITKNTAQIGVAGVDITGGGINNSSSGRVDLKNTIIAGNLNGGNIPDDCNGELTSQGFNLIQNTAGCTISGDTTGNIIGQGPFLESLLQDNGGPTRTHALRFGSPAIDAGNPDPPGSSDNACITFDQRNFSRPVDGNNDDIARCDIGAFEFGAVVPGF